jgi:Flp pilus assembly CpaE family ATPase
MAGRRQVLLVTQDQATTNAVGTALEAEGSIGREDVFRDLRGLSGRMEIQPPNAVLVDIDPAPTQMLSALDPLVRQYPETRFIVLSEAMAAEYMLEAMQMGARHYMLKDAIRGTLSGVLHRLCSNGHTAWERGGSAITILSASGGCGATTLAVNLACEIAESASNQKTLLVDLDPCYGGVGAYLGIDGQHGVVDLMGRSGTFDAELLSTTAQSYSDKLQVLISAANNMLSERLIADFSRLDDLMAACKRGYSTTVIDAPRVPMDVAADLARLSNMTLVVFQLTVKDVRMARSMISALETRGIATASILPIVNRYHRRNLIVKLEEAERAMNGMKLRCLSNDFQGAGRSSNFGQPLLKAAPRSVLRTELQQLASQIATGSVAAKAR